MKSFIICLSKIPSSLETAVKVKEKLDEYGMDAELFEGSYGNEVLERYKQQGRRYHPWSFKGGPLNPFTDAFRDSQCNPGEMGCFDSHYRLWEKCVELNEPIMIFEDDVLFTRPYQHIDFEDVLITVFGNQQKSAKYYHYLTDPEGEPRAEGYWQSSMPGTPGYAIKPHAAKKLVDMYKNTWLPSDNAMMSTIVKIEVHSHMMGRALVGEDGKKSLVRGKSNFWDKVRVRKILITGNSGYIGSHLTKMLADDPMFEVHGLDKKEPVITVKKFYSQDIKDTGNWRIDEEYDCVVHLAAEVSVGESVKNPLLYYQTNAQGTVNLLKNIKTRKLVVASTGAAEQCISPYGTSKKAMEDLVKAHCIENYIPYTIFRFYNVIGSDGILPTNQDGLFSKLIAAIDSGEFTIHGVDYNTPDGTCIRDYCHVNEISNALARAIDESANGIENLGHGIGTSVKKIVEIFKKVNDVDFQVYEGPRRDGDIEVSVLANPSKYIRKSYKIEQLLKINL